MLCTNTFIMTSFVFAVTVEPTETPAVPPTTSSNKTWEIMKSIAYGGLAESVTSLGIVTSAASGDASTCKQHLYYRACLKTFFLYFCFYLFFLG